MYNQNVTWECILTNERCPILVHEVLLNTFNILHSTLSHFFTLNIFMTITNWMNSRQNTPKYSVSFFPIMAKYIFYISSQLCLIKWSRNICMCNNHVFQFLLGWMKWEFRSVLGRWSWGSPYSLKVLLFLRT